MRSYDRLSIYMLITKNWNQANYYILPPDHEETMITSLIMDGYDWNQYTVNYLPTEVQLDQPAHVHPNALADNLDMFWCR